MGTIKMAETFGWLFKEADAPTQGWEVYASREKFHSEEGITLIADASQNAMTSGYKSVTDGAVLVGDHALRPRLQIEDAHLEVVLPVDVLEAHQVPTALVDVALVEVADQNTRRPQIGAA